MKIYLVGGAVRDHLLNRPIREKDWVVVGATPEKMLSLGFFPVGKDFPVFLHPKTKEEYALARTERKIGRGYTGFEFNANPSVTLEEDLKRRDLTINAMAEDIENGTLIDPYHGQTDLKNHILRHVSDAFVEDPVRILRVARFSARFKYTIADETLALMQTMVQSGEMDALVPERVWKELERALTEPFPPQFFSVLKDCGALRLLFPWDFDVHALQKSTVLSSNPTVRFAALCHLLSKTDLTDFRSRYRIPGGYLEMALVVNETKSLYKKTTHLTADQMVTFFLKTDAFRREARFKNILIAYQACYNTIDTQFWREGYQALKSIDIQTLIQNIPQQAIAETIHAARLTLLKEWLDCRNQ